MFLCIVIYIQSPLLLSLPYGQIFSAPEITYFIRCLYWHLSTSVSDQHTPTSDAGELTHKTEHGSSLRLWSERSCYFSPAFCADVPILPMKDIYFTRRWCLSDLSSYSCCRPWCLYHYRMSTFHCVWGEKRAIHVVQRCRTGPLTLLPHLYVPELIVGRIKRNKKSLLYGYDILYKYF